jgi:hypothetical protein
VQRLRECICNLRMATSGRNTYWKVVLKWEASQKNWMWKNWLLNINKTIIQYFLFLWLLTSLGQETSQQFMWICNKWIWSSRTRENLKIRILKMYASLLHCNADFRLILFSIKCDFLFVRYLKTVHEMQRITEYCMIGVRLWMAVHREEEDLKTIKI